MPWAWNNGVRIHWEEEGSGEPLLLIMGLSLSLRMWGGLRPFLAQRFRTILFDNRCVGDSDSPRALFSIHTMAGDAVKVMEAAGVRSAGVLGLSMGGMIAQQLALEYPQFVSKLILGCTHCGGLEAVRADLPVLRALVSPFGSRNAKFERIVPFIYDEHTPRERIDADLALVRDRMPRLIGYLLQLTAIMTWHSWERLPRINVPVLVIHGESDRLIPPANAKILADRIRGAKLVILPRASHIFPTDQPEMTRKELMQFLETSEIRLGHMQEQPPCSI